MVAFLRWARSISVGVLNGIAKFALFLILVTIIVVIVSCTPGTMRIASRTFCRARGDAARAFTSIHHSPVMRWHSVTSASGQ